MIYSISFFSWVYIGERGSINGALQARNTCSDAGSGSQNRCALRKTAPNFSFRCPASPKERTCSACCAVATCAPELRVERAKVFLSGDVVSVLRMQR
jgi:hypothetical protein